MSSGPSRAGIEPLGWWAAARPRNSAAAASVGQLLLAERHAASFARHGVQVGRVPLTADDLDRRVTTGMPIERWNVYWHWVLRRS